MEMPIQDLMYMEFYLGSRKFYFGTEKKEYQRPPGVEIIEAARNFDLPPGIERIVLKESPSSHQREKKVGLVNSVYRPTNHNY